MSKLQVNARPLNLPEGATGVLAKLSGSIDASTVPHFEEQIEKFLREGVRFLLLDCAEVAYINSTGMGLIIKLVDKYRSKDGDLKLISVPAKVVTLFKMLGLEALVDLHPNEEAAMASVVKTLAPSQAAAPAVSQAPVVQTKAAVSYPVQFKCPSCAGVLEIRSEGKYRCPRCGSFFAADPAGGVKAYPPRKWKAVEIRVPCELDDLEWVRTMMSAQAARMKFEEQDQQGLEQAVDEACTLMVSNSPPGSSAYHVAALSSENELVIAIYSYTCGAQFKDETKSRMSFDLMRSFMEKVEVLPLPPNGQMIKLTKSVHS